MESLNSPKSNFDAIETANPTAFSMNFLDNTKDLKELNCIFALELCSNCCFNSGSDLNNCTELFIQQILCSLYKIQRE